MASQSPSGDSVSAAASGDAAQWAAPITDRRGSGDQALNGAHWAPAPLPAFFRRKLGKELHPPTARTCASGSMSTSEASCHRRELSGVQPPRTCASLLMSTSAASCPRRELPGVQPPRTCASLLMSTSAASCPRRELSRAATRRELPGVQPQPRHWVSPAPPGAPAESSGPSKSR